MTPLTLNAGLLACLGAGMADLTLLNLAVVPALYPPAPEDAASPQHMAPAAPPERVLTAAMPSAEREPAAARTSVTGAEPGPSRPVPALELVTVLEFDSSSHHLDSAARSRLQQQLATLRGAAHIVIVGHADESGPEAFNERLSRERAEATLRQLLSRSIPAERVEVVARGEREPLANGNSRRVEIFTGGEP